MIERIKCLLKKHISIVILATALLVALCNYLIYPTFINRQLNLIDVVVAARDIEPMTTIEKGMLATISFPADVLPASIEHSVADVIGKTVRIDRTVIKGSFFYEGVLMTDSRQASAGIERLKEGELAYPVTFDEVGVNAKSMVSGQRLNLYFIMDIAQGQFSRVMTGLFLQHVRILEVDLVERFLLLAIREQDLDYLITAQNIGRLAYLWTSASLEAESEPNSIYSSESIFSFLDGYLESARIFEDLDDQQYEH